MIDWDAVLQNVRRKQDRLEQMLTRMEWPFPGHLGAKWLDDVAAAYLDDAVSATDVAKAFVRAYEGHGLSSLEDDWRNDASMATRLPILLDVLTAHRDRRYALTVPVVFAQLEGLIAEANAHSGRLNKRHLDAYLLRIQSSGHRFHKMGARLVSELLWREFTHGDSLPGLSRHAILHGADTSYATPENSLRAILYFDTIREGLLRLAAGELGS